MIHTNYVDNKIQRLQNKKEKFIKCQNLNSSLARLLLYSYHVPKQEHSFWLPLGLKSPNIKGLKPSEVNELT